VKRHRILEEGMSIQEAQEEVAAMHPVLYAKWFEEHVNRLCSLEREPAVCAECGLLVPAFEGVYTYWPVYPPLGMHYDNRYSWHVHCLQAAVMEISPNYENPPKEFQKRYEHT